MNVYMIVEDGETFCIKAEMMSEAVSISESLYLDEVRKEAGAFDLEKESTYYHDQVLQSCSLMAELKN